HRALGRCRGGRCRDGRGRGGPRGGARAAGSHAAERPDGAAVKRAIVALGCALVLGACGERPLTWYYRLAGDIDGVARIEARIRAGGCEGEVVHEQRFAPGEAMTPPSLGAGEYGFEVEVRDAECRVIGTGCQPI